MIKKKVLAFIPARGGSKGIPRKNIRLLKNKPLIAYTILAAKQSIFIDKVIVSTDDNEIAEISTQYGAQVIHRPIKLALDNSSTIDALIYTLNELKKTDYFPDISILLQPTTPLRSTEDIENAMDIFLQGNCDEVISVVEQTHSPYWTFKAENGFLNPLFSWNYFTKRRQELPKCYIPNGAIYIGYSDLFIKNHSFYCKNLKFYEMPVNRSIDIDRELDLKFCEFLLRN